jgi:hypothetical protein
MTRAHDQGRAAGRRGFAAPVVRPPPFMQPESDPVAAITVPAAMFRHIGDMPQRMQRDRTGSEE